jgi:hypothetical protein
MDDCFYFCSKCKTVVAELGPHEAKHHQKYMRTRFSDPMLRHFKIEGSATEILPVFKKMISYLLLEIIDNGNPDATHILPYACQFIKRMLSVIHDDDYLATDEDASTCEDLAGIVAKEDEDDIPKPKTTD